jgi:hypothetical protein
MFLAFFEANLKNVSNNKNLLPKLLFFSITQLKYCRKKNSKRTVIIN